MTFSETAKITTLAVAMMVAASAGWANQDRQQAVFERIDTNGDGELNTAELQAHAQARFERLDDDRDGFLSRHEIVKSRGGNHAQRLLRRFDANQDGVLDAEELAAAGETRRGQRAQRMFERVDTDEDGQISLTEMMASRTPTDTLARLDTDGNGTLNAEEFAQRRIAGKAGRAAFAD
ncbi:MAG: EF-hand domain-containing protein [Pseudomonadota bacterium]